MQLQVLTAPRRISWFWPLGQCSKQKNKSGVVFDFSKGKRKEKVLLGSCVPCYPSDGGSLGECDNGWWETRTGAASECKHADKGDLLGVHAPRMSFQVRHFGFTQQARQSVVLCIHDSLLFSFVVARKQTNKFSLNDRGGILGWEELLMELLMIVFTQNNCVERHHLASLFVCLGQQITWWALLALGHVEVKAGPLSSSSH